MQNFEVVGFDNGYDYVKMVLGADEGGKIKFPSMTYKPSGENLSTDVSNQDFGIDNMEIEFEGKEYYIGSYAVEQDPMGGEKNFTDDKFKSPSEIVKLLASISLYIEEEEAKIDKLVLGLNIDSYKKFKDDIVEAFENKTFKFKIGSNKEEIKLYIDEVMCIPQGIGAYYDQVLNYDGIAINNDLLDSRYALTDLGGRTIDGFVAKGIEVIRNTDIGVNYGMSDAFREVASELGDEIPYNLIEQTYIKGKNKVFWKGRDRSIDVLCKQAFNNLADKIYNQLVNKWDKQLNRVEFIMLCGGGSRYLGDILNDMFNIEVKVIENPQFSNASGYYKLGVYDNQGEE
ncbi:ParM/StbA family protein [Fuchsiella alkaliacetigena]|uniref:ParM/StbA family protein n=1 Tax=Fuchsiella alkaliacetigena TaxID=957042 RepID=UPI00200B091D|nr:ParM/StbA family protein [Fuchsiella alkaliacetigena]MCK8825499.1 ParM/StbA family protein [Fuchsiella alkaliacetigena]